MTDFSFYDQHFFFNLSLRVKLSVIQLLVLSTYGFLFTAFSSAVIMPPSALDRLGKNFIPSAYHQIHVFLVCLNNLHFSLASLHIEYPMLFELSNPSACRVTHCGVLEFVADEGLIYLPYWVMLLYLVQLEHERETRGDKLIQNNVTLMCCLHNFFLLLLTKAMTLDAFLSFYR